jgi:predicted MFS family arabinose efflux permease
MEATGSARRSDWTPELRMQRSKERITAVLAFLLVASTMVLTYLTFSMAGQDGKMKDAMGVLSLLFGLAGVVVGYYFGRVPGDARAVESHQTTQMAMNTMRDMSGASSTANQWRRRRGRFERT